MDGFQNLFLRKFREKLTKEISDREAVIIDGKCVGPTDTDYRVKVEAIKILKHVRDEIFEQVVVELLEEDRNPEGARPRRRA